MRKHLVLLLAGILLTAIASFANTSAVGTNVVSPTLAVSANVEDAVELTLSTGGTAGISHCTITPSGSNYSMSFGTVDALAVNTGCGNVFAPTTPGSTPAVYWTDYQLTPAWSGLTATSAASITAYAAAPETGVNIQIPSTADQSTTTGLNVSSWTNMGTTAGTASGVVSGSKLVGGDGTALTRFLALSVAPTATAAASPGTPVSTTVTFTMTIQ